MLTIVEEEGSTEEFIENLRPWKPGDERLLHIIQRTLKGTMTGEEQLTVKFDRALATKGMTVDAYNQALIKFCLNTLY